MEGRKVMNMKRFIALIMAFVMVLLISVPAFAEDTTKYTITITNATDDHVYEAYQIFTGTLDSSKTTLSDVEWGKGVDGSALLTALKADTTVVDDTTTPETTVASLFANCSTAADVAKVLSDNNTNDTLAERFAQLASEHLSTTVAGTSTESTSPYTIEVTGAGYYLIKDKDDSVTAAGDAYTDIILWVYSDTSIASKTVYPTVSKNFRETSDQHASIGDTISYSIVGTVPDLSAYSSYTYIFNDTLSKGLTYVADSLAVYVSSDWSNSATLYKVVNNEYVVSTDTQDEGSAYYKKLAEGTDYTLSVGTYDSTTGTAITVTMLDAKSLDGLDADGTYIVVVYSATLNANAVIGGEGNPNEVTLTYSNNPNGSTSTGITPVSKVNTLTYEIDITKVDGTDNTTTLPGAEFVLYKDVSGTPYYATATDNGDGTYTITGWTDDDTAAKTLVSYSDGSIKVIGLDEGTYYLKETKAPDGYNTITNAITVEIDATYSIDNDYATIESLKITVDGTEATMASPTTGIVTMQVTNNAGSVMPSTGGIGVTVYVVGGLVLIVAALGVMMAVKVKGKKNGN